MRVKRFARVRAMALNFDGRHNREGDVYPPEDKGPFVGLYDEKVVQTPWGRYTQHIVHLENEPDGYRLVEPSTVRVLEERDG